LGCAGKKEKGEGWAVWAGWWEWVRVWFFSFSFLFISFQPFYSKSFQVFQKELINHTIKQKPMHST
jgi:hypothetical protein